MIEIFEKEFSPYMLEILRSMGDGALIIDEKMNILFFNKAAEDIFGYSSDEVVGQPLTMLLPVEARKGHDALVKGFADSGDVRRPMKGRRVKGLRKDGVEFYAEAAISKIMTDQGMLFSATIRDITALTLASEKLHEQNFVLNSISNAQKQMIDDESSSDIFGAMLDDLLAFTGSEYGFVGYVHNDDDGNPYLKTAAITDISWNEDTRKFYELNSPAGLVFTNLDTLFGEVLKSSDIVIANDAPNHPRANGVPSGHPPLNSFLGIPVKSADKMIGMFGIANRQNGYDQDIIDRLKPFITTMATIFEGFQQKKLHAAEEKRNERMAQILDVSVNDIFIISLDTLSFETVSKRTLDHLGYSYEEMKNMSPMDMNPEFTKERFLELIMPVLSGEAEHVSAEREIFRKDGSSYTAEIFYRLFDADDQPVLVGTMIDRTEAIKAENALRESQKSLAEAQKIARIGNWAWDLDTKVQTASDILFEMFELDHSGNTITGDMFMAMMDPEMSGTANEALNDVIRRRRDNYTQTIKVKLPSGKELWCHGVAEPVINDEGRVVGLKGTIQDVTDRVDMEHQLRQAQKMEAVGQLTGGLAHDFNNLLAVVLGTLDLLKDEVGDDPLLMKYIENSRKAATRGAELTQRLLAFSRKQSLKPLNLDVHEMIKGMYTLLRSTVGDSITINFEPQAEKASVRVDVSQMESAILNLAINARDAMPDGGVITISTENVELTAADIDDDSNAKPGTFVRIDLTDNGTGMTAESLARAFDPFYTTKGVGEGSGLGLSMVYGFMMQSGGLARISSVEGEGTTVSLYVPYVKATIKQDGKAEKEIAVSGAGQKILVLEDEENVRLVAKALLEKVGFEVWEAETAVEALKIFYSEGPFSLILSDIELKGGMKGPEFVETIRKDHPETKVLFMSGFSNDVVYTSKGAKVAENTLFLNKPFRRGDLLDKIVQLMDGEIQIG